MFEWLKKKVPCVGSVLFRGSLPPRPGEFQRLSGAGLSVKNLPQADGVRWGLELAHPEWGKATLQCARDTSPPPHLITDWMYGLTAQEREEVRQAGCGLDLRMEGRRAHVLRDRKTFLRFLRAVMADDGLVACDWVGRRLWARAELEDELSHDADLDIGQIFEVHAVQRNDNEAKQPGEEYGEQSESKEPAVDERGAVRSDTSGGVSRYHAPGERRGRGLIGFSEHGRPDWHGSGMGTSHSLAAGGATHTPDRGAARDG